MSNPRTPSSNVWLSRLYERTASVPDATGSREIPIDVFPMPDKSHSRWGLRHLLRDMESRHGENTYLMMTYLTMHTMMLAWPWNCGHASQLWPSNWWKRWRTAQCGSKVGSQKRNGLVLLSCAPKEVDICGISSPCIILIAKYLWRYRPSIISTVWMPGLKRPKIVIGVSLEAWTILLLLALAPFIEHCLGYLHNYYTIQHSAFYTHSIHNSASHILYTFSTHS